MSLAPAPSEAERRQAVLAQCRASQLAWDDKPGRTLMLFLDGTGNILGDSRDTNVVKLFRAVDKSDAARQIAFYDPGVGTPNEFPAVNPIERGLRASSQLMGLALGRGVFDNIAEAYRFLVEQYQDGDRICLFGFSRGAFTARAVAGMVNMYGLVHATGLAILPLLVRSYFSPQGRVNRAGRVREDFAREVVVHFSLNRRPLIHFIGVWDTVESVGLDLFGKGLKISNAPTVAEKRFVHIRHALALHETRRKYTPRNYTPPGFTAEEGLSRSFDERWFRGNHCDVGGSYVKEGLSGITLQWMREQAAGCGMRFVPDGPDTPHALQARHDETVQSPFWAWTGLSSRQRDPEALLDPSALPLEAARPALPMRRAAPVIFWLGWVLALAALVLGWQAWSLAAVACSRGGAAFSLLGAQLLAPWWTDLGISCRAEAIQRAIRWDWYFWAVYGLLLAWLVAWGARRAAPTAVAAGRPFGRLALQMPWLMLGLVGADAVENLLSRGLGGSEAVHRYLTTGDNLWPEVLLIALALSSVLKFACLALLAKVILKPV